MSIYIASLIRKSYGNLFMGKQRPIILGDPIECYVSSFPEFKILEPSCELERKLICSLWGTNSKNCLSKLPILENCFGLSPHAEVPSPIEVYSVGHTLLVVGC